MKTGMMLISHQAKFSYTLMTYQKLTTHAAFGFIWNEIKLQLFRSLLYNFPRI